jgi:hypothetical protein
MKRLLITVLAGIVSSDFAIASWFIPDNKQQCVKKYEDNIIMDDLGSIVESLVRFGLKMGMKVLENVCLKTYTECFLCININTLLVLPI